jgi:hypothetical protein
MTMRNAIPKISGRWAVAAFILLAALGSLNIVGSTKAGEPRSVISGKRALRVVRVTPGNGVISALEPVIVEVEITNTSSELVGVWSSTDLSARIEVRDSHGRMVGASPVYTYADVMSTSYSLVPGQSMRSFFIPSVVYPFRKPGSYSVRIMLLNPPRKITYKASDLGPVTAEVTIPVSVQPFDKERLKKLCNKLIEPRMLRPSGLKDFPPNENMMALWSVHNNAALPALKFVIDNWSEHSYSSPTLEAIRRIRTPESTALLKAVGSRHDRIGRSARSAKQADLRIHDYDYLTDWTHVRSPEATANEFLYYYRHRQWGQAETLFSENFRRKHASRFKDGSLLANKAGKSVQSILNDPRSKALRSRKQGKFVFVDVGQEASGSGGRERVGFVQLQLVGGGEWRLSDFPGSGTQ